jgi:hypothetical protein
MWASVVAKSDPDPDGTRRVVDAVAALAIDAPRLERADDARDHDVLPRR